MSKKTLTRRNALALGAMGAAALAVRTAAGSQPGGSLMPKRMPTAFVPHAGGPVGHVDMGLPRTEVDPIVSYWRSLRDLPGTTPRAVLAVSAHWEARIPTVMSSPSPPMLYDYGGFPAEAYQIAWPAPGDPALAGRVRELLAGAGFETAEDPRRGFDHGTFVPLKMTYPANVPVVQLSLKVGLDAAEHLGIGRALTPLRDEGVFIVGSGDSFHNMHGFTQAYRERSVAFNAWLADAVAAEGSERDRKLADWTSAPFARDCHPREDHLIPLMVAAGAAAEDVGRLSWRGSFFGTEQVGFHFG